MSSKCIHGNAKGLRHERVDKDRNGANLKEKEKHERMHGKRAEIDRESCKQQTAIYECPCVVISKKQ